MEARIRPEEGSMLALQIVILMAPFLLVAVFFLIIVKTSADRDRG